MIQRKPSFKKSKIFQKEEEKFDTIAKTNQRCKINSMFSLPKKNRAEFEPW